MSGLMPASSSALITPTCAKPRAPPPPSASATSGRSDFIGTIACALGGSRRGPSKGAQADNSATANVSAAKKRGIFIGRASRNVLLVYDNAPATRRLTLFRQMEYSAGAIALIAFAFVLAGLVKGVLGMGLPTVAMGLLALAMPPAHAAAVLVVPSLVTNVWQLTAGPNVSGILRRFGWMMLAICVGTWLGIGFLAGASKAATMTLGIVLAVYGLSGLVSLRFSVPARLEPWLSPPIGFATGVLTGATGVFVIPAVPYLASLDIDREGL